mmetsp:Transcript_26834/g.36200  ORF Transcript_26834/g.36200 Transcript_26834/m.36200 type:complete len:195 (+) Transcript_26834:59-643(+)
MPARRKKKEKASFFQRILDVSGAEAVLVVAVMLGALRFYQVPIPIVDNIIARVKLAMDPPPAVLEPVEDVHATMKDAAEGRPIVLIDVLVQLRHFCGEDAKGSCSEWLAALPKVATAVGKGPGTWDRKPLQKAKALELDGLLTAVTSLTEAERHMSSIRTIGKELLDAAPKSVKKSLTVLNLMKKPAEDEVVIE